MAGHQFGPGVDMRALKTALIAVWRGDPWKTQRRNLWSSLKPGVRPVCMSSCRSAIRAMREIIAEVGGQRITVGEAVEGISDVFTRARIHS